MLADTLSFCLYIQKLLRNLLFFHLHSGHSGMVREISRDLMSRFPGRTRQARSGDRGPSFPGRELPLENGYETSQKHQPMGEPRQRPHSSTVLLLPNTRNGTASLQPNQPKRAAVRPTKPPIPPPPPAPQKREDRNLALLPPLHHRQRWKRTAPRDVASTRRLSDGLGWASHPLARDTRKAP